MVAQIATAALDNTVAVVSAGTSDMPVAEEAALTAEFYGNTVERIYVGVAGLHRLLARMEDLRSARVSSSSPAWRAHCPAWSVAWSINRSSPFLPA